jgi:hypothetical protein
VSSFSPSGGAVTLFNNDTDGTTGQGAGGDVTYAETNLGRSIDAGGVSGRYIRWWSTGNTVNEFNHYVEVQVFAS